MPLSLAQMNFITSSRNSPQNAVFSRHSRPAFNRSPCRGGGCRCRQIRSSAATPAPAETRADAVANSVVKVFSTVRYPDPYKPWTKQAPSEVTGSGVVIEGKRILTSAHVVLYASQVQMQANQAGDKISATVEAVAPGIDLAVLKLDDETFFDTHPPLPRAKACRKSRTRSWRMVIPKAAPAFPSPRASFPASSLPSYNYPVSGLRIQIDAAINPGNSGGPAVVGDKMIGLAFSRLGRRGKHRLHHSLRGDRIVSPGHRGRPLRRQTRHVRRLANAGKPRAALISQARQIRRRHGRAQTRQHRSRLIR